MNAGLKSRAVAARRDRRPREASRKRFGMGPLVMDLPDHRSDLMASYRTSRGPVDLCRGERGSRIIGVNRRSSAVLFLLPSSVPEKQEQPPMYADERRWVHAIAPFRTPARGQRSRNDVTTACRWRHSNCFRTDTRIVRHLQRWRPVSNPFMRSLFRGRSVCADKSRGLRYPSEEQR
jgi:hypothetical protein